MLPLATVTSAKAVKTRLSADTKFGAIQELLDALLASSDLNLRTFGPARDSVFRSERANPSGCKSGVAVPYGVVDGLSVPRAAVGVHPDGLDFGGGEPSKLVVLMLYPQGAYTGSHDAFPFVEQLRQDADLVGEVAGAASAKELHEKLA